MERFDKENFRQFCDTLSSQSADLRKIIALYGYPPLWTRPNNFATIVLIILEQQVSLASAYAAYKKLNEHMGKVTPQRFLELSDEDLRGCYFSRQKIIYARGLATALVANTITQGVSLPK